MTRNLDPDVIEVKVPKSVKEILEERGVEAGRVESVVWSHWHFDHCGTPSEWPASTSLIVGPGSKAGLLPGYPTNPESPVLESDLAGRDLIELNFPDGFKIGNMEALDYFGDGSLYFLNSPGHAIGHVSALARVTSNPDSFILMGGHAWHHTGALFASILRDGDKTKAFYEPRGEGHMVHYDQDKATRTIEKLQEVDPRENVLMAAAHDESLLDVVDFFPKKANGFMDKGWVKQARWQFLRDFAEAVGYEGEIKGGRRDWSKPKSG